MEDQINGAAFNVGDVMTTSGVNIEVERFQYGNGNWNTSGKANIDNRNYAQGSGLDLNAENVNLHPRHGYAVKKIKFKFGELGGNNNISINGDFRNVPDLIGLNGQTIGGSQVTVNAVQQGNYCYYKKY